MTNDPALELQKLILSELESADSNARAEFLKNFAGETAEFVKYTAIALQSWTILHDAIPEGDDRRRPVVAILFTAINFHTSSFKLFLSGHTTASGALFRQVLEAVSMALLCSAKGLDVLDRFLNDKYSTTDVVKRLARKHKQANVKPEAVNVLKDAYNFYHKYAHLTKLTIATGANFQMGGAPNVGGFFDLAKLPEYTKEVNGRVSFARVLPNIVDAVAHNMSTW